MSERVSSWISCFFLMCLLKFLFAENLLSQSSQYTSTCVVLCFSSLSWLGKDFGLLAHLPRVHKNILDLSVLCINLTWFTKYSLTIVLYGHSSQWNCWLLIWFSLWTFSWITSLFSVWQILPHSLHDHIFPIFSSCTAFHNALSSCVYYAESFERYIWILNRINNIQKHFRMPYLNV